MDLVSCFVYRASPFLCNVGVSDRLFLAQVVPGLLRKVEEERDGTDALRDLYSLCEVKNRHYRLPLVDSKTCDVLAPLSRRLYHDEGEGIRLACLCLNNLSIPSRNKQLMLFDRSSNDVLKGLCHVVRSGIPESCIAIICLVNLSLLRDNVVPMLHTQVHDETPSDNTLLPDLETTLARQPQVPSNTDVSVQSETIRWTCGLIKNLSASKLNAFHIAKTRIPAQLVAYLNGTAGSRPSSDWTPECVENAALQALVYLSRWNSAHGPLRTAGAISAMTPIVECGGIHGHRAEKILLRLGVDSKSGAASPRSVVQSNVSHPVPSTQT